MKIIFSVFGDGFCPEEFSEYIGVIPTDSWIKRDKIPQRMGLTKKDSAGPVRKESAWEYSMGFMHTLFFEDLAKSLEEVFSDKVFAIKEYVEKHKLNLKIDVVVEIVIGQAPSLYLSNSFISFLNRLNAAIDFDIYNIGE